MNYLGQDGDVLVFGMGQTAQLGLDPTKCIECDLCLPECPSEAWAVAQGGVNVGEETARSSNSYLRFYYNRCTFEKSCVEVCPTDALFLIVPEAPVDNNDDVMPSVTTTHTNVKNPCLGGTTSKGLSQMNAITQLLKDTFNQSKKFNLTITDQVQLEDYIDGHTTVTVNPDGTLNISVQLNQNTLPHASQEFTLATLYHEIIHAYLRTQNVIGPLAQHTAC